MTAHLHLHLPHPHLPEAVAEALTEARHHLRKPKPVYTDPAVIARWAQWLTPEQWTHEHDGSGER